LEALNLNVQKVVIDRITVVKLRMDSGGGSGTGCFKTEIWMDTVRSRNNSISSMKY